MSIKNFSLIVLLVLSACSYEGSEEKQPNIIVFMVDDMGWQDTSVPFWTEKTPFNAIYQTPNMERLASQGMKFTQAYSNSVCTDGFEDCDVCLINSCSVTAEADRKCRQFVRKVLRANQSARILLTGC